MSFTKDLVDRVGHGRWVLLGNLVQSALSFIILITLVRLGTKKDVGTFAYAQAVLLPAQLFFTLKLRTIECSDVESRYSSVIYHQVRRLSGLGNIIAGAILIMALLPIENWLLAFSLLLSYSLLIIRESYGSNFLKENMGFNYFINNSANVFFSVLGFGAAFWFTRDLLLSLVSLFGFRLVSYFVVEKNYAAQAFGKEILNPNNKKIKHEVIEVVKLGLPLGFTALLGALFSSVPRMMIEQDKGVEALGVFSAVSSLVFVFNVFINSYVQASLPAVSRLYLDDSASHLKVIAVAIAKIIVVCLIVALLSGLWGGGFLRLAFGDQYQGYYRELMCVVFTACCLGLFSIGNLLLSSRGSYFVQLPIYMLIVFFVSVFVYVGLEKYDLVGAIIGQGLGYLLGFFACFFWFFYRK